MNTFGSISHRYLYVKLASPKGKKTTKKIRGWWRPLPLAISHRYPAAIRVASPLPSHVTRFALLQPEMGRGIPLYIFSPRAV